MHLNEVFPDDVTTVYYDSINSHNIEEAIDDAIANGCNVISVSYTHLDVYKRQGTYLATVLQDKDSVARATDLMNMTLNGKTTQEIKKQIKKYNKEQGRCV